MDAQKGGSCVWSREERIALVNAKDDAKWAGRRTPDGKSPFEIWNSVPLVRAKLDKAAAEAPSTT